MWRMSGGRGCDGAEGPDRQEEEKKIKHHGRLLGRLCGTNGGNHMEIERSHLSVME